MSVLEVRNVTKLYPPASGGKRSWRSDGVVTALRDVSLGVAAGQFLAILGPSGAGKTTLLLAAGALLAPDGGQVRIDGQDPYAMAPEQRARLRGAKIGFVFQQFQLVPYLNVMENVLASSLAKPTHRAEQRARELVERFSLADRIDHVPAELSTGERQRVALARALLNQPKLLLADEPTGNLDEENARIVLQAMTEFGEAGGAVLLVTHSSSTAEYAQHTVSLRNGTLQPEPAHP